MYYSSLTFAVINYSIFFHNQYKCYCSLCNSSTGEKTGFVPGSVMRRSSTIRLLSSMPSASQQYCKDVNLNPPPRRCI